MTEKNKNNIIKLVSSKKSTNDNHVDLFSETLDSYLLRYKEQYKKDEAIGTSIIIWYESPYDPDSLTIAINSEDIPLIHYMCSKVIRHLEDMDLVQEDVEFDPEK